MTTKPADRHSARRLDGRVAIAAWASAQPAGQTRRTFHQVSNVRIEFGPPGY